MPKFLLLLCAAALLNAEVLAQKAINNFSLEQCIDYTMKNNNAVKNASIDAELAKYRIKEVNASGLPQINGTGSYSYFVDIPTSFIPDFISPATYGVLAREGVRDRNGMPIQVPAGLGGQVFPAQFGTKHSLSFGLEASQLLFSTDYFFGRKAAMAYTELTNRQSERTRTETAYNVVKAYYLVLITEESIRTLDATIERLKKTSSDMQAMNKVGFTEKVDADRLEILYNNISSQRKNLIQGKIALYNVLKYNMNMPLSDSLAATDKLENVSKSLTPVLTTDSLDYTQNTDYNLVDNTRKLTLLDFKSKQYSRLPTLVGFASTSENGQSNTFNFFDSDGKFYPTTVVGVKLSVPIIGFGKKTYQIKQAKLALQKTENTLEDVKNGLNLGYINSRISYNNATVNMQAEKKNLDLALEVVRVTKAKYEQGVGSNLEVVTAETTLRETQGKYEQALYDAIVAKVALQKAEGTFKY